ncbi:MAG TPA: hypothetical protein VG457_08970 [Planctomycetota bacterium]|nr:hypothetical protein [Planctomycetota bacterium]
MATNGGGDDLTVICAWCKTVLKEGHPTSPDQISHGCCIPCKRKYFPTLDEAVDAELPAVSQ